MIARIAEIAIAPYDGARDTGGVPAIVSALELFIVALRPETLRGAQHKRNKALSRQLGGAGGHASLNKCDQVRKIFAFVLSNQLASLSRSNVRTGGSHA